MEIKKDLDAMDGKVKIMWILSHVGIKGNEKVDILAKEAAHEETSVKYSINRPQSEI